jgi:hypothetical protein
MEAIRILPIAEAPRKAFCEKSVLQEEGHGEMRAAPEFGARASRDFSRFTEKSGNSARQTTRI